MNAEKELVEINSRKAWHKQCSTDPAASGLVFDAAALMEHNFFN